MRVERYKNFETCLLEPVLVVKAEGEDLVTPGYLRGDRMRRESAISDCGCVCVCVDRGCVPLGSLVMKPWDRNDSPILL